ncbi:hypothetical protein MAR_037762, partial [Mya arenaria]
MELIWSAEVPSMTQGLSVLEVQCGIYTTMVVYHREQLLVEDIIRLVVGRLAAGERFFGKCFALKLVHIKSRESYWLHNNLTMYQVKQKYETSRPPDEW